VLFTEIPHRISANGGLFHQIARVFAWFALGGAIFVALWRVGDNRHISAVLC
jgi:hypothetical protein